jgi:DNA-binding transcriptional LysR family regulator
LAFDLRQLRYVLAAAEYRSFRRAAEALRVKESTLSRRIRSLEEQLGVALFARSRAGVRPTPAGADLLRTAQRVIDDVEAMTGLARAAGRGEAGHLTVGFYTSLSAGNLRATLIAFSQRYPQVEVRMVEGARQRLLAGLKNGTIDVAIVTGDPAPNGSPAMPLWSERVIVALPEKHPLAAHDVVYWTDLKGETFLLACFDPGPDVHDLLIAKLAAPGERPKVVQHNVTRETIKSLVGAGFGVSLLCEACIGASYAGVVYREAQDGNGPSRVGYTALWEADNDNPVLKPFLKLLEERYPVLSPVEATRNGAAPPIDGIPHPAALAADYADSPRR